MPDPEKQGDPTPIDPEAFKKLEEQVGNLNKGIATYRDEAQKYKTDYEAVQKKLTELEGKADPDPDEPEVVLDPEEQKKLDAWAKQKGYVTNEALEAEKNKLRQEGQKSVESQAVSEFLEKHPEYDQDQNWERITAEFSWYKTPNTLDGYRKLLNKIHADVTGSTKNAREDGKAQARAELNRNQRLTLGGGGQGGPSAEDVEIEAMAKKYPKLSRDQIEDRLSEIRSLYPKK